MLVQLDAERLELAEADVHILINLHLLIV